MRFEIEGSYFSDLLGLITAAPFYVEAGSLKAWFGQVM